MPETQAGDPQDYLKSLYTPPAEIAAAREKTTASDEAVRSQELSAIQGGMQQRNALMSQPIHAPANPNLQNIQRPPHEDYTDPLKVFQNPAVLIASLGSLFTRAPLTTALKAGAGAMEAYHKGEKEEFDRQTEIWKNNTESAMQQNKVELEKYNAEWKKADLAVSERMAKLQAIASGTKDEVLMAAIKSGRIERIDGLLDAREKANEKLGEALLRYQSQSARNNQKQVEKQQQLDSVVNQIDRAMQIIKNHPGESVVGLGGMVGRAKEFISGEGSDVSEFEPLIRTIQTQAQRVLAGTTRVNKADREKIDTIVPGLGAFKNTQQVYNALAQLKVILEKKDLLEPETDPLSGATPEEIREELRRRGDL